MNYDIFAIFHQYLYISEAMQDDNIVTIKW